MGVCFSQCFDCGYFESNMAWQQCPKCESQRVETDWENGDESDSSSEEDAGGI